MAETFFNPSRDQVLNASGDTTFQIDGNIVSRDQALELLDTKFKEECEANVRILSMGLGVPK